MTLRKMIGACIGGIAMICAASAASAQTELKPRKIGVFVITLQSESLTRWSSQIKAAAEKLHWEVIIKDGQNNPSVVATALPELLNEGVDAVITMALDAPLMTEGLKLAKTRGIPVIATTVDVSPAGKELFTATYAPDSYEFGVAIANYLLKKYPHVKAVAQDVSIVYAADRAVVGAKETLAKGGGTMEAVADVDVTNLVNSFTQTATDLAQGHPNATVLIATCCDFSPLIDLPALKAANRPDMLMTGRYDNATSLQAIRAGSPLVVPTNHSSLPNFEALTALAAYFANKTPIPPTMGDIGEIRVIDKDNVPAQGDVWPFDADLATYSDRWSKAYKF
jgi:ABC-type sugar transport system substrate-binding protein